MAAARVAFFGHVLFGMGNWELGIGRDHRDVGGGGGSMGKLSHRSIAGGDF